jgi:hypothetical protein
MFSILSLSCTSWVDELTKKRTPYNGKEFRIDGCYYSPNLDGSCEYLFFYSNGVLLRLNDNINITSKEQFQPLGPYSGLNWSIFQVEGTIITRTEGVETNFFSKSNTLKRYYKIENDTTLLYTYNNNNFYYHFKYFIPKHDSTNVYIK